MKELERGEKESCVWSQIGGSDEYLFWKDIYDEAEEQEDEEGEITYDELLCDLPRLAPHIDWRLSWDGTDEPDAIHTDWKVICVPDDQFVEAQYVFNRYIQGDDLTCYNYRDRYPAVYNGNNLATGVAIFVQVARELTSTYTKLKGKQLLQYLQEMLPRVYLAGRDLSDPLSGIYDDDELLEDLKKFRSSLTAYGAEEPDEGLYEINEELPDTIVSIMGPLLEGLELVGTGKPDKAVAAVHDWWFGFKGTGWALTLLECLQMVHTALGELEKSK
jgi:hypothetical protein